MISFHNDMFNANSGLGGLFLHFLVDYLGGKIPGICLDPACRQN
jgi:hypothetical protein